MTTYPLPMVANLRQDPLESYLPAPGPRAMISQHKTYLFNAVLEEQGAHLASLKAYPPRQKLASLDVNVVIQNMLTCCLFVVQASPQSVLSYVI